MIEKDSVKRNAMNGNFQNKKKEFRNRNRVESLPNENIFVSFVRHANDEKRLNFLKVMGKLLINA